MCAFVGITKILLVVTCRNRITNDKVLFWDIEIKAKIDVWSCLNLTCKKPRLISCKAREFDFAEQKGAWSNLPCSDHNIQIEAERCQPPEPHMPHMPHMLMP